MAQFYRVSLFINAQNIYTLKSLLLEDNSMYVNGIDKLKIIKLASIDISYVGTIIHNFAIYYEKGVKFICVTS